MIWCKTGLKYLRECDMFGTPVSLNLDNRSHYKSKLGAIVSILSIFLITTLCWSIVLTYLNQENIAVNSTQEFNPDAGLIQVTRDQFMFAISIEQDLSDFADNPFFGITVQQVYQTRVGNKISTITSNDIPMEKCTESSFSQLEPLIKEQFLKIGVEKLICPKSQYTISMAGQYSSETYSYLKITAQQCSNSVKLWNYSSCAGSSELATFLATFKAYRITLFINNYTFNPSVPDAYYNQFLDEDISFTFIPGALSRTVDVFMKPLELKSDSNPFFYSSYTTQNFIFHGYQDIKESSGVEGINGAYITLSLRRSPQSITIKRDFQKLTAIMVQFGGLIKFMVIIGGLVVRKYNAFLFSVELANKLYDFSFEEAQTPEKTKFDEISLPPLTKENNLEISSPNRNNTQQQIPNPTEQQSQSCYVKDNQAQQSVDSNVPQLFKSSNTLKGGSKSVSYQQNGEINIQLAENNNNNTNNPPGTPTDQNSKSIDYQKMQNIQAIRKDSVRNIRYFQECIQNQYLFQKSQKKKSLKLNGIRPIDARAGSVAFDSNNKPNNNTNNGLQMPTLNDIDKGDQDGLQSQYNFFHKSKIIHNLVNFREMGYKKKKDFLVDQFKNIIGRSKKIRIKFWYFIKLLTFGKCFKTEENILIEKASSFAQKDLDIYIILDKLQEIEKIKKILLDQNQLILFNFSRKPIIEKDDSIYKAISLRNLQIKHRKQENKSKLSVGVGDVAVVQKNQQKSLFSKKLQFDNIDAYEVKKIARIQRYNRMSRSLIKELGTELREIFELSKLIESNQDNTPKAPFDSGNLQDKSKQQQPYQNNFSTTNNNQDTNSLDTQGLISPTPSRHSIHNLQPGVLTFNFNHPYPVNSDGTACPPSTAHCSLFKTMPFESNTDNIIKEKKGEKFEEDDYSSSSSSFSSSSYGSSKLGQSPQFPRSVLQARQEQRERNSLQQKEFESQISQLTNQIFESKSLQKSSVLKESNHNSEPANTSSLISKAISAKTNENNSKNNENTINNKDKSNENNMNCLPFQLKLQNSSKPTKEDDSEQKSQLQPQQPFQLTNESLQNANQLSQFHQSKAELSSKTSSSPPVGSPSKKLPSLRLEIPVKQNQPDIIIVSNSPVKTPANPQQEQQQQPIFATFQNIQQTNSPTKSPKKNCLVRSNSSRSPTKLHVKFEFDSKTLKEEDEEEIIKPVAKSESIIYQHQTYTQLQQQYQQQLLKLQQQKQQIQELEQARQFSFKENTQQSNPQSQVENNENNSSNAIPSPGKKKKKKHKEKSSSSSSSAATKDGNQLKSSKKKHSGDADSSLSPKRHHSKTKIKAYSQSKLDSSILNESSFPMHYSDAQDLLNQSNQLNQSALLSESNKLNQSITSMNQSMIEENNRGTPQNSETKTARFLRTQQQFNF